MAPKPKANLLCPLCGAANGCALARSGRFDEPCWCQAASFGAELLARVPAPLRDVACVCAACAASAAESANAPR